MIQMQTALMVADNSGAKRVKMIMPIGGSTSKIATIGDKIKVTVKEASPDGTVKKGQGLQRRHRAGPAKEIRRKDGTYIRFDRERSGADQGRRHTDRDPCIRSRRPRTA